jgi:fumarate reductase flavoprotein subunit
MNRRKVATISFLIAVFFVVPPYLIAADRSSEQNAPAINPSDPAQMKKPDAVPPKSGQAMRLEKHAPRGVQCAVCHESNEPTAPPRGEKCITCHSNYVKEKPKDEPNPHKSHVGELSCGKCHKEHRESVMFCNKCHVYTIKVP